MYRLTVVALSSLFLAACVDANRPVAVGSSRGPSIGFVQNSVDTSALPDLTVDSKSTQNNWVTRVEDFPADFCSVVEGGLTPGTHTVIRFTVTTPNIGKGDVFVGSPLAHMDPNHDGNFNDSDGLFEFASCHKHFHFQHYATYRLIDSRGRTWKAAKRGFCMLDTDPYNLSTGDGKWSYRSCGDTAVDGFQGVSGGWSDTYVFKLGGQYFVLDGGDGQPAVPPGVYTIQVEVNPAYDASAGGICPRVKDPLTGKCHQIAESDYTNNTGSASVVITDHPGRAGYGPLKNSPKITASDEIDHKGQ